MAAQEMMMLPHPAREVEIAVATTADGPDLRAIATLNTLAWGGQVDEVCVGKKAQKLEKRIAAAPAERQGMVVATVGGQTVGYCRVFQDAADESCWWLEGLVVHPSHRRQAVGKTAVYWGIAYAAARGATRVRSETHADNLSSIAFHHHLGFRNDGVFVAADGGRQTAFSLDLRTWRPSGRANSYDDPHVAESYDLCETQTDDVALLRGLIGGAAGLRILEPFCGSGRMLVPLASDGQSLVGIDLAAAMLDRARAKITALPAEVQRGITLIRGDAMAASWPGGFDLVLLASNCFYELGCAREQEACVAAAAAALKPGGWVYVDNDHMEGPLPDSWQRRSKAPTGFPKGRCADGARVTGTSQTIWSDPGARLWLARRGTTVIHPDGSTRTHEWIESKHPVSKDEVAEWLPKHGLVIENLFGDRKGSPYSPESPRAIFWARKQG
jgi:SAM-dependent methyltransferase